MESAVVCSSNSSSSSSNGGVKASSRVSLFSSSSIDVREELEERHLSAFATVQSLTADKSENESLEALSSAVSRDGKSHEEICLGLLVGSLCSVQPERFYRDLSLVARDGLAGVLSHLTHLVLDKWTRLTQSAKSNLLWLTKEMIKGNVSGTDSICWNLMRQIAGGDVSRGNLWLADSLLDIFIEHRAWLEKFSFLLASVVYTYLRVIEDHVYVDKLREKEVKFVVGLMRDHFNDVIVIGRDLLRVLQYVAKIKDFEELWSDILYNPKSLAPNFTGITMLMHTRTSRRFLQSRITPEMERKLVFLTSQVRFGTHKRYQEWFQKQYLSTNESQSLRCDLIRFIVGVIHPTNELLCSDIIPRWAVIGWLLTTCTSPVAASNAKLSLFYDWLFFQPDKDNIMNIEPAILVMHHSLRPHPAITATLLDFLCRIITNFHPQEQEKVRNGIYNSLRQILDKRVLPSLSTLFDNHKVDEELRIMLRDRFGPFISQASLEDGSIGHGTAAFSDDEEDAHSGNSSSSISSNKYSSKSTDEYEDMEVPPPMDISQDHHESPSSNNNNNEPGSNDGQEEEEEDGYHHKEGYHPEEEYEDNNNDDVAEDDAEEDDADEEEVLDKEVKDLLKRLRDEPSELTSNIENLLGVVTKESLDFEECSSIASCLSEVLQEYFEAKLSSSSSSTTISDSSSSADFRPIFIAFRSLTELSDSSPGRSSLLNVLAELYTLQPRLGYHLLYFLKIDPRISRREPKSKAGLYRDLCEAIDSKFSLDICLVNDMRQCQEDDVPLFVSLVPEVFSNFPKVAVGNVDLLYLIVSCVDGRQIQNLVCHILSKSFVLLKRDSSSSVLFASLSWETFEQYALWQLLSAHDLPFEALLPLIPKLDFWEHAEALSFIALHLKLEKPTSELLRILTAREIRPGDYFVSSSLSHWLSTDFHEKLVELLAAQLLKQAKDAASASKKKRSSHKSGSSNGGNSSGSSGSGASSSGGSNSSSLSPSAELTLSHVDALRKWGKPAVEDLFASKSLQNALQTSRSYCSESQKRKFSELFALADAGELYSEGEEKTHKKSSSKSSSSGPKYAHSLSNHSGTTGGGASNHHTHYKKTVKAALSDSSEESSDSVPHLDKAHPLSSGSSHGSRGSSSSKRGRGKNPRKRASKISYKEAESTDDDSSDNEETHKRKKKKRLLSPSDSE